MNGPTSKSRSERANACRLGRRRNGFFRAALARVAGLSLLIGAVIATTIPTATGAAEKQRPEPPSVGAQAPEIAFVASDGKEHKLSEFRGRPVMLFLFASWCPTCVYGTQELARQFSTGSKKPACRSYNCGCTRTWDIRVHPWRTSPKRMPRVSMV